MLMSPLVAQRNVLDTTTSPSARDFVDLFESHSFVLLNGRSFGDIPAQFTFCSAQGRSTVDLAWITLGGASSIVKFEIGSWWLTDSDHFPAIVNLSTNHHNQTQPLACTLRWDPKLSSQFKESMRHSPEVSLIAASKESTSSLLNNFVSVTRRTAKGLGMLKSSSGKNHTGNKWYDDECHQATKSLKMLLRASRNALFAEPFLSAYLQAKKKYKNLCNYKKKAYKLKLTTALSEVGNPREFWHAVKQFQTRQFNVNPISTEDWEQFYQTIYPPRELDTTQYTDVGDPSLDREISQADVLNAVAKTRAGKAAGIDEISSDFFKALPQNWLLYLTNLFNRILSTESLPVLWPQLVVVLLHKKGWPSGRRAVADYRRTRQVSERVGDV
ncbi:hypothetical protein GE061_001293 [Apolygus lucorum]|uniref:Endonuclease/exonuclease/phosphatase domain-containing protein n=1 Tax=Apolygus lucorum TaxID=248454 RepID=A0A8S9Y6N0_APOLU|nr:hypothetical protein GE061_001293 [Apolygus lucorum]